MSNPIIKVENLGKKYFIRHERKSKYSTLRDAISNSAKNILNKTLFRKSNAENEQEEFWALKDISFEVNEGDRIGIIGRNGAGKSTLLKILSRITEPTTGKVTLHGRVASLLEVGTGFHPELSGRENIYLNGAILGMTRSEIKRKFDEIVDFAEVEKFLDTPVKHYSSGMYVRLAFAVAAHLESEILLVDEVLAVGDAEFQQKCLGKMENMTTQNGRTILFVSHNIPAIQKLCSKTYIIDQGTIQKTNTVTEAVELYYRKGSTHSTEGDLQALPRMKGCEKCLDSIWITDRNGNKTRSIVMGDDLNIYIKYHLDHLSENINIGVGIDDFNGRRICSLNNFILSLKINPPDKGVACVSFHHLNLMPGKYYLSPSICHGNVQILDYLEKSLDFNILPGDVFRTGKLPDVSQGIIYLEGKIHFPEEEKIK